MTTKTPVVTARTRSRADAIPWTFRKKIIVCIIFVLLITGTATMFKVITTNSAIAASTIPAAPTKLTATISGRAVNFAWVTSDTNKSRSVKNYTVRVRYPSGQRLDDILCTVRYPASACQISNMSTGIMYIATVVGSNDAGVSEPSNQIRFTLK